MGITSNRVKLLHGTPLPNVSVRKPVDRTARIRRAMRYLFPEHLATVRRREHQIAAGQGLTTAEYASPARRRERRVAGQGQANVKPLSPDMRWADFCDNYVAAASTSHARAFTTAERRFRATCEPASLADVDESSLTQFASALLEQYMQVDEARRRVTNLRLGIKWGFAAGVIDPAKFAVDQRPDGSWQWRTARSWAKGKGGQLAGAAA